MAAFCTTDIRIVSSEKFQQDILSKTFSGLVLVMTESGEKRWQLESFVQNISAETIIRISDVPANPTADDIHATLVKIASAKIDTILTIGGGSAIDLAKGISAFYSPEKILSAEEILENIKTKSYLSSLDIIAVPTTSGTGSEVTQWATVWDMKNKEKYSIDAPQFKPKNAYIVPEFTLTLPKTLTLSTGLDALAHAMEAYWSKFTTPLVQDIAYRSIEIITSVLKSVLENPSDIKLREKMARASLLAGLAFSQTRTTACHAISYPMTMYYGVPHGFAVALSLAGVADMNKGHFPNDDELFALFETWGGIKEWLDYVCEAIVTLKADALGVKDMPMIADKAGGNGRMGNNPVNLSKEDVLSIIIDI